MVRATLVVVGIAGLILTLGFFIQAPWATVLWPLQAGRLSYIFISSILAAAAGPVLWIGLSGELRAMLGGAINFAVTYSGFATYAAQLYVRDRAPGLLALAVFGLVGALACLAIVLYSRQMRFIDPRPTPGFVRVSFALFALVLILAGGAMVLQRPNIFPWPISPESSVFFGWIFLGAFCYFVFGLAYPSWANARGQLLGFLAYDLVLIVPFLNHFRNVPPNLLFNLIIYTGVLIFSGGLAVYYLFIYPPTRFRATRREMLPQDTSPTSLSR